MGQIRTAIAELLDQRATAGRARVFSIDWELDRRVSRGSSTLLDRLLDLLTIFRRPVPVPVKVRRSIR